MDVVSVGCGGGGWWRSRLTFLDSSTIKKWPISFQHAIITTHAHLILEYHKDCKLCLIVRNLNFEGGGGGLGR